MTAVAPGQGHKTSLLFASVAIVLVTIAGAAAFTSLPKGTAPSFFVGVKSTSTESTAGLVLGLSLNKTTISPGQTVAITVYERNILKHTNNISASDKWPVNGLSVGPCGNLNLPVGIVVYRGNLSVLAVPGVQPLQLYEPGTYNCPAILSGITAYAFQPISGEAEVVGSCSPNPCFTSNMSSTIDVKGYWGTTFLQSSFTEFAPGIYTVAAGDEWGKIATLQFEVTSGSATPSSSSTCTTPVRQSNVLGTTNAYVLTPGSTGIVCVSYEFRLNGTYSFTAPDFGPLNGSSFQACGQSGYSNGTMVAPCGDISITAQPATFSHTGTQNVTVAYTIQVGTDAKGLYWLFIGSCDPIVLAIGTAPSSVPGPVFLSCISSSASPTGENVAGVTNVRVVGVTKS